jgi:hypothetical protein
MVWGQKLEMYQNLREREVKSELSFGRPSSGDARSPEPCWPRETNEILKKKIKISPRKENGMRSAPAEDGQSGPVNLFGHLP